MSRAALTQWSRRHRGLIEKARGSLQSEYGGFWAAVKANRLAALQSDYEMATEQPDAGRADLIRTRAQLLRQVAEETGQLPPKTTVAILPVSHILEGVDLDLFR